jgi:hypothetical protein
VLDADDLGDVREGRPEIPHNGGSELDRALLQPDVGPLGIAHQPVRAGEYPGLHPTVTQHIERAPRHLGWQNKGGDDGKIRPRDHSAIEAADRCRDFKRFEQHAQAAGRPAADNGENDSAGVEFRHRGLGTWGQSLVLGHQCAIHIGDDSGDVRR